MRLRSESQVELEAGSRNCPGLAHDPHPEAGQHHMANSFFSEATTGKTSFSMEVGFSGMRSRTEGLSRLDASVDLVAHKDLRLLHKALHAAIVVHHHHAVLGGLLHLRARSLDDGRTALRGMRTAE